MEQLNENIKGVVVGWGGCITFLHWTIKVFLCALCVVLPLFHNINIKILFQIEHLKACQEMAASRTLNWQKFCLQDQSKS